MESLPSAALRIVPRDGSGAALKRLARAFRRLPVPVIGRVADGALLFDVRCLEDAGELLGQIDGLEL